MVRPTPPALGLAPRPDPEEPTQHLRPHAARVDRPRTSAEDVEKTPPPPERIGPYEIEAELGRGGMGVVWLGRDPRLGRQAAVKMLRAALDADPVAVDRFRLETEVLARLRHPNIVQVYEVGTHLGAPYMALEYVAGGTLARYLAGRPLPPRQAAELVRTLAEAIHHAHQQGVIHRDLKPANVLLSSAACGLAEALADGTAKPQAAEQIVLKIADFGLARLLEAPLGHTQTGQVVGTPWYMAPEQALGRPEGVGTGVDVYALGAILFECLTGAPPHADQPAGQVLAHLVQAEVRLPRGAADRDLGTICLKCLDHDPARRYASAAQLAEDLGRYLAGETILARPPRPLERLARWARRHPAVAGLTAALLAAVVAGLTLSLHGWAAADRARRDADRRAAGERLAREEAQQARLDAERRETRLSVFRGQALAEQGEMCAGLLWLARALEGAHRAGAVEMDRPLRISLAGWRRQLSRPLFVLEHPQFVLRLAYSPDGKVLATAGRDARVRFWDAATGAQLPVVLRHPSYFGYSYHIFSIAFSPDSRLVATGSTDARTRVWDAATGKLLRTLRTAGPDVWALAFDPAGKRLATVSDELQMWDPRTGKFLETVPLARMLGGAGKPLPLTVAWHPSGEGILLGLRNSGWAVQLPLKGTATVPVRQFFHNERVASCCYSPDARWVLTGSHDGTARVWDVQTGQGHGPPLRHTGDVRVALFNPDGHTVLTGSGDGTVRLWHADNGLPLGEAFRLEGMVSALAFRPDGRAFAYGGRSRSVWVCEVPPWTAGRRPVAMPGPVIGLQKTRGPVLVATRYAAYLWEPAGEPFPRQPVDHDEGGTRRVLTATAASPDGRVIATAATDEKLRLWSAAQRQLLRQISIPGNDIRCLTFSPDGRHLLVTREDYPEGDERRKEVGWVYEVKSGRRLRTVFDRRHTMPHAARWLDGQRALVGLQNGQVQVWDLGRGEGVGPVLPHADVVAAVAMAADGRRVLAGCRDGHAQLWDVVSGKPLLAPLRHESAVLAVAFADRGQTLVTGSSDGLVRLWDAATGLPLGPPLRHSQAVSVVLPLEQPGWILTGCRDGLVRAWNGLPPPLKGEPAEVRAALERQVGLCLGGDGVLRTPETARPVKRITAAAPQR